MKLREILAAIAAVAFLLALIGSFGEPGLRPAVLMLGLGTLALLIRRRRYGVRAAPPEGATPTDERFVDPETGKMVRVWYDASSGTRSYIDDKTGAG